MTNEVTRSEFARLRGFRPSYVTQLANDGRLVLTDDGKRVKVAESVAKIEATRDPSRRPASEPVPAPEAPPPEAPEGVDPNYQNARAKREHYAAEREELRYRQEAGELMVAAEVAGVVADILTVMRNRMEAWPDTLAPQLAPIADEQQIRARLADEVEIALGEVSARFAEIGKGGN